MKTENYSREKLISQITKQVIEVLRKAPLIPIGVSNRHMHLSRSHMDLLFGFGKELTPMRDLKQPGQYACEETVTIKGPKGAIERVRILGPLRSETQVEISVTDGFALGIHAPVRESGQLQGTPGIEIIGPCGRVQHQFGAIVAHRHIHMTSKDAANLGVKDKDRLNVSVGDEIRGATLHNVVARVSDSYALEMHLDLDEANALGVKNGDFAKINN